MKITSTALLFLLPLFSFTQNLLSNGGFEQYSSLPGGYCEWDRCTGWTNVNGSTGCGAYGTPDYYRTNATASVTLPNVANGDSINPHGGNAIMGFITREVIGIGNYREYIMTALNTPMVKGTTYQVSFYLSNGYYPTYGYGSNNIGLCFSNTALHQTTYAVINRVPQVEIDTIVYTHDWAYFQFSYTADSAYQYLTIGNFKVDSLTQVTNFNHTGNIAYYFIDDIIVSSASIAPPVAGFTASDSTICQYGCINYQNTSLNATSWQWTFAGGSPSTSTDSNPQVCYLTPGIYNVTLVASNSGGTDTLSINNYVNVNVAPPTPVIQQINDTLLNFTADSSYKSYQWYSDSALIPNATDTFLIISKSGNYNVEVTGANGCKTAAGINVILGLQNTMSDPTISLWPNPVGNNLQLTIRNWQNEKGNLSIIIYNVLGEVVQGASPLLRRGAGGEADISMLPSGIYFIQLLGEKERWVGRFVKQ